MNEKKTPNLEDIKPCLTQDENTSSDKSNHLSSKKNEALKVTLEKVEEKEEEEAGDEDEEEKVNESNQDDADEDDQDYEISDDDKYAQLLTKTQLKRPNTQIKVTKYENPKNRHQSNKMTKNLNYKSNEINEMGYMNQMNPFIGNAILQHQLSSGINNGLNLYDQMNNMNSMNNMYGYNGLVGLDYMNGLNNIGGIGDYRGMGSTDNFEKQTKTLMSRPITKSFNLKNKRKDNSKKKFDTRILETLKDY